MCTGTWPRERTTGWAYSRQAPDPSTALRRTAPTLQASVSSVLPLHFRCSCTIRTQACQSGIAKAHASAKSSLLRELDSTLGQFFWGALSEGVTPSGLWSCTGPFCRPSCFVNFAFPLFQVEHHH